MLNHVHRITVPSVDKAGQPLSPELRHGVLDHALRVMSRCFGGATAVNGQGAWVNGEGKLVCEPVTVVSSYADHADTGAMRRLAESVKLLAAQEAVMVEVDGQADFI